MEVSRGGQDYIKFKKSGIELLFIRVQHEPVRALLQPPQQRDQGPQVLLQHIVRRSAT